MTRQRALVRRPSPRLADGLVTHIERDPADPDRALEQWRGYVDALEAAGWATVEVADGEDFPDGVFIEDTMVIYADLAVITRPGAPERRAEVTAAAAAVADQGYSIRHIEVPGTLDGGDVLRIGSTVYVGMGGRTNAAGIEQLRHYLEPRGARVTAVPTTKVLHLKSAVTALPDGQVIGYPPLVDDSAAFDRFLAVPEEAGAHVVLLDDRRLLVSARAPRTAERLAGMGYQPVPVDISEFEKLEGCVTCLSVRLRAAQP